ncbi:TetR/AcrR family transcriptional regulator [Novosphingobium sp. BL-8H]|uniref:TetR/AcrR family transcriptional regulator n=1 Tax=Novosphingobium sp. BL-8H TaxID=3127640 RepID=UPI0037565362
MLPVDEGRAYKLVADVAAMETGQNLSGVARRGRSGPWKGQGPDLKQLERCALTAFSRRGFESVGLRELAASVEIAPTLILYRYGSKLGLWKSIVDTLGERVDQACCAIKASYASQEPFPARASAALRHFVLLSIEIPELSPLFVGEMSQPGERQDYILGKVWSPFFDSILPMIEDAERYGNGDLGAPKFAAFTILSMIFAAQYMIPFIDQAVCTDQGDAVTRVLRPIERLLTLVQTDPADLDETRSERWQTVVCRTSRYSQA